MSNGRMIEFTCSSCGRRVSSPESFVGSDYRCASCVKGQAASPALAKFGNVAPTVGPSASAGAVPPPASQPYPQQFSAAPPNGSTSPGSQPPTAQPPTAQPYPMYPGPGQMAPFPPPSANAFAGQPYGQAPPYGQPHGQPYGQSYGQPYGQPQGQVPYPPPGQSYYPPPGYAAYPPPGQAYYGPVPKSRVVYVLLGLFLGGFGIHNFYSGHTSTAVIQLLITLLAGWLLIPLFIVGIWALIEVCTVTADAQGVPFQ